MLNPFSLMVVGAAGVVSSFVDRIVNGCALSRLESAARFAAIATRFRQIKLQEMGNPLDALPTPDKFHSICYRLQLLSFPLFILPAA